MQGELIFNYFVIGLAVSAVFIFGPFYEWKDSEWGVRIVIYILFAIGWPVFTLIFTMDVIRAWWKS
jgi:hypothetical protein